MVMLKEEIRNAQGERLDYAFHAGDHPSSRIVVLGHGVTGNKDRPLLLALTQSLNAAGLSVLGFSFSGNGDSEGRFVDSCISKEVEDLGCVLDALGATSVTYIGHSMGAAVGVLRAATDRRIDQLISLAGMVDTAAFALREFGDVTPDEGLMWDKPECPLSSTYMNDLAGIGTVLPQAETLSIPWLLLHGTADDVVPLEDSLRAQAVAGEKVTLATLPGADHVFDGEATQIMCQRVIEWLIGQPSSV